MTDDERNLDLDEALAEAAEALSKLEKVVDDGWDEQATKAEELIERASLPASLRLFPIDYPRRLGTDLLADFGFYTETDFDRGEIGSDVDEWPRVALEYGFLHQQALSTYPELAAALRSNRIGIARCRREAARRNLFDVEEEVTNYRIEIANALAGIEEHEPEASAYVKAAKMRGNLRGLRLMRDDD